MSNPRRVILVAIMVFAVAAGAVAQTGDATDTTPDGTDPALYAVGALGASNLYATYFLLGTLADGYATAAYTATFADELARDIIGLSESSIEVLQDLRQDDGLSVEDESLVADMVRAHQLLINQAFGLIAYVEDASDTDDWFSYRRQAWELITELLGIQ